MSIEALAETIPAYARDTKINLSNVLKQAELNEQQLWGTAVACAVAARNPEVMRAIDAEARQHLSPEAHTAAKTAASIMAMNNVYYRFRHMVGKPVYREQPAGLRMNRLMQPATNRTDFELMALAVSAINGCEMCVRAHEKTVTESGLTPDHVNDAVRIAATVYAAAVALEAGEPGARDPSVIEVSVQGA